MKSNVKTQAGRLKSAGSAASIALMLGLAACGGGDDGNADQLAAVDPNTQIPAPAPADPNAQTPAPAPAPGTTPTPAPAPAPGATPTPAPTPATPTPTPTPAPAPPAPTPPVAPTGFTAVPGKTDQFFVDGNANGSVDAGERVILADADGHYYELVKEGAALSYADAKAGATGKGGHLFTAKDNTNLEAVRVFISTDNGNGDVLPAQTATPAPDQGAFVGLENSTVGTAGGWTWVGTDGAVGGAGAAPISDSDPNWYTGNPAAAEYAGVMSAGFGTPQQMPIFSAEADAAAKETGITHYIIEWENAAAVK